MKIQDTETKTRLVQRLRRIEGQVRGVQAMLNEERDCREIMQQLTAIHAAVQATSRTFLQDYTAACLTEMGLDPDSRVRQAKMVEEMIALLDKTP
ncbi:MAG TPA: metal-sensitive transcriptional regulator [Anaerolineaceae bacterium]|nr:metal-sensitive transcriptional regulator [Anaerolineaceae bacterium]HQF61701.1 metal-sensitive transcriptional regulator [Anaerolineaceae bacterium]HQH84565.1 metal-sensitive transcriptional regulator [Anaerolineaceae bacterium]